SETIRFQGLPLHTTTGRDIPMRPVHSQLHLVAILAVLLGGCGETPSPSTDSNGAVSGAGGATARIDALLQQVAGLEARAQRIEDSNAIKRLQRAFGYYMSEGQWAEVAELSSDDATFEFGRDGVYRGKARILAWLQP